MKIDISNFAGMAPLVPPFALAENMAQLALDCDLRGGVLAPLRGVRQVMDLGVAGVKSIYKFGYQNALETQWWLAFDADVDVAYAPMSEDVEERTYFTGDWKGVDRLRKTRFGLAQSGPGPYPTAWLDAGVPRPEAVPGVTASGGDSSVEPEYRVYVCTFVTTWDEESEPGPPSAKVMVYTGGTVNVGNLPPAPSGAVTVDRVRIYRSTYAGNQQSTVQFVAEVPIGTTSYADSIPTIELSGLLQTNGWDAPPDGMRGLTSLPAGVMIAFKNRDIYFSPPLAPYAYPVEYSQSANDNIVGLGRFGTTVAVLTKGAPLIGAGNDGENIVLAPAEVDESCAGCESKRGIVSMPGGVYYPTTHGLALLSPSGSTLLTADILQKPQWATYSPATMLGCAAGARYIGFYDAGAMKRGLIFDPAIKGFTETSIHATAAHRHNGKLYLAVDDKLCCFEEGAALSYTWKSRRWILPTVGCMSVGRVIADSYPVLLKVFADGVLVASKAIGSSNEFTLPTHRPASAFEIQLEGSAVVRRVAVAESSEELGDVSA